MGYAKAAELNGSAHVLELATPLKLSADQRARTRQVFDSMQKAAASVGRQLVDRERHLDASFADKAIAQDSLAGSVQEIAALQGRLREIHLQAHLAQTAILTPEQIQRYEHLRGYRPHRAPSGHRGHAH